MSLEKVFHNNKLYLILLAFGLTQFSCRDLNISPSYEAKYHYEALDNDGKLGVSGLFTINFKDSPDLQGKWEFFSENDSLEMGAQVGEGQLEGWVQGDTISINLHPGYADHNVILHGRIENKSISGQWSWITFSGPTNQGTFVATKK